MPSNDVIAKNAIHDLDVLFEGQHFIVYTIRAIAKKCEGDIYKFWYLPSNGVIAKIVLHDLNLLSEGKNLNFYISETVRASAKVCVRHL